MWRRRERTTITLLAIIDVPNNAGQGIAWDWTVAIECPTLASIYRPEKTVIVTAISTLEESEAVARPYMDYYLSVLRSHSIMLGTVELTTLPTFLQELICSSKP